jgi:hypothetical protein
MNPAPGSAFCEPQLAAMPQLREKPRQGFETKKTAWKPGPNVCNSTAAIGMRAGLVLEGVRKTYRARYYNPNTGRFLSEDPLEFDGGDVNLYRYVWNAPTDFVDPTGQIGFGVSAGVAAEGGLVVVGTGAQGSVGAGGFVNTSNGNVSAGAFKSGGAFAGGVVPVLGSWGVSAPSQPSNANWAFGAYAGGGAGLWLSNANSVGDLSGPFYTTSFNLAWKFRALTLNLSVGKNACGQTIWIFNYGGPLGNIPTGGGFGGSLSGYNTNTVTTGRACACKGN